MKKRLDRQKKSLYDKVKNNNRTLTTAYRLQDTTSLGTPLGSTHWT